MKQQELKYARQRLTSIFSKKSREGRQKIVEGLEVKLTAAKKRRVKLSSEQKQLLVEAAFKPTKKVSSIDWKELWGDWHGEHLLRNVQFSTNTKLEKQIEGLKEDIESAVESYEAWLKKLSEQKTKIEDELVLGDCEEALKLLENFSKSKISI